MKISSFPGRVSVAERLEHRFVDSETLGSILGWGSQSFLIYDYEYILKLFIGQFTKVISTSYPEYDSETFLNPWEKE